MTWHGYFGIENVGMNNAQRGELVQALRKIGRQGGDSPAKINHWRVRLDNDAAIFEAEFADDELSVNSVKKYLGAVFGISWTTIAANTQQTQYGPLVTFSRNNTDYLRMILFGGIGAEWSESGDKCRAYLAANRAAWEADETAP